MDELEEWQRMASQGHVRLRAKAKRRTTTVSKHSGLRSRELRDGASLGANFPFMARLSAQERANGLAISQEQAGSTPVALRCQTALAVRKVVTTVVGQQRYVSGQGPLRRVSNHTRAQIADRL